MSASPLKQLGRAGKLRAKARKLSEKFGESGDYDYENPRVQKLLAKAKEADKPKPKSENDARISMSYERPDMPSTPGSPLNSAYASGAGGMQYVSTAGAFQRLQDQLSKSVEASLDRQRAFDVGSAKMEDWDTIGDPGARFATQKEFYDFYGKKGKKK